ncbi:hypothetical protein [Enterobacter kobei]|uniref:hypothetical protein n=1 Tax=Enterobacter kobei TaxID=208224 RepID=UPI0015627AC3|nr:hypothetical protein [Enterobacter kobei]
MTLTKEWLQKEISDIETMRDEIPFGLDEDGNNTLAALKMALAGMEAEPVAWLLSGGGAKNNVSFDSGNAYADPLREVTPLYTATPAPVVPDAIPKLKDDQRFKYVKDGIRYSVSYANGWNACRAAMLQGKTGGNSPVIPDGWVMVPVEPTHEMLEAGDEQFGTYDVYRRMIAAAPQQEAKP